jgi:hypothetical protein
MVDVTPVSADPLPKNDPLNDPDQLYSLVLRLSNLVAIEELSTVVEPLISDASCNELETNAGLFSISAKSVLIPAIAAAKEADVEVNDPLISAPI